MKQRMPKMLIELSVMLLVFALSAALCLKAFLWADEASRQQLLRENAWQQLHNHAQRIQADPHGDWAQQLGFDENWQIAEDAPVYFLEVAVETPEQPLLGVATVTVRTAAGETLAQSRICWQEVSP